MRERVLRRVRLRDDLKPVQIYTADACPINPDWAAVTHSTDGNNESFNLVFFRFDGTPITWEQFETLEIDGQRWSFNHHHAARALIRCRNARNGFDRVGSCVRQRIPVNNISLESLRFTGFQY